MIHRERARLIPTSGIKSEKDAETRATSAFLAVLSVVRPFSKALLDGFGASNAMNARVETFTECRFDHDGRRPRPDGMIRIQHGSKPPWQALVEVKTGNARLEVQQINEYWDLARVNGFDAVITISSEIAPAANVHPTAGLKVRTNSPVQIHHLSWARILTEARMQTVHKGVEDTEQAWLLEELFRYLTSKESGAYQFEDMGPAWVEVRDACRDRSLGRRDEKALEVAEKWSQLLSFAALRLGGEIGGLVRVVRPDPKLRPNQQAAQVREGLVADGCLAGALRVPNAAADLQVFADIRARQVTVSATIEAPRDRGTKGRITWLLSQSERAPASVVVESWLKGRQAASGGAPLGVLREDRSTLAIEGSKELVRFRLSSRSQMGTARKKAGHADGFVESVLGSIEQFYEEVLQPIKAWRPTAPRRQTLDKPEDDPVEGSIVSPSAPAPDA